MADLIEKRLWLDEQEPSASPRQTMLATWQQHTYAEFVLKDADAALATMTENPYVLLIGSGVVRVGRAALR
jgi:carboxymethylenebutenolidase